ncbi:MAG: TIM barrel protein [Chloroflexota bacterium]|nr:TIM barrel protein [Chloroflexota bacterium]
MRIALQDSLLGGGDPVALCERAAALGVDGLAIASVGLEGRLDALVNAARRTGVRIAGIHYGREGALLDADMPTRERALARLRAAIAAAVDLEAAGVVIVPHYGAYALPDLFPWKSSGELYAEMLHMHLRTLSDFCYALGTSLFIQTAPTHETAFISRLEQANAVVRRIKHPNVRIALDLDVLVDEMPDPAAIDRQVSRHGDQIGYVARAIASCDPLHDHFFSSALRQGGYDGWLVLTGTSAPPPDRLIEIIDSVRARLQG